jgi:glycyl-tRNA synthetase
MDDIVSLSKRRGFLFQSSEIYGGFQGFWDYGPMGIELKRNVKEAWWRDMITAHDEFTAPAGAPSAFNMVGVETSIIMNPQVWKSSGHYDLFHDMMVDCRESKKRYRFDHLRGRWGEHEGRRLFFSTMGDEETGLGETLTKALKVFGLKRKYAEKISWGTGDHGGLHWEGQTGSPTAVVTPAEPHQNLRPITDADSFDNIVGPDVDQPGTLTAPREFNLMFKTIVGALGTDDDAAFLRPETAQGIFVNFKNVCDSSRVKIPFGVAQIGKSFRNEITPRNFTFRSREFEQMEIEFFCHPDSSPAWYQFWRDRRMAWYRNLGLSAERLILREHDPEELSHYSTGTADVEYAFPFLDAGEYGELEGVAHRGDFDLRSHMEGKLDENSNPLELQLDADGNPKHKGSGKDLTYFDDQTRERFTPHVIEPSAGADRATLAFLCEAYNVDEAPDDKGRMQSRTVLKFHPRLAPIKAAVFPLIKKEGMPDTALGVYRELKSAGLNVVYSQQGAIGRRYRQQDEIGTPWCITIDGDTASDGAVTVRDRDSLEQVRVPITEVTDEIQRRLRG